MGKFLAWFTASCTFIFGDIRLSGLIRIDAIPAAPHGDPPYRFAECITNIRAEVSQIGRMRQLTQVSL